ncbi:hypothetical protein [Nonomuraea sp. NPDC050643]|uniref:hypothetical protein n=1 Tax=Nonomuraea sp. NPDC050643 TaxID=3155660 RepID=UPI0033FA3C86
MVVPVRLVVQQSWSSVLTRVVFLTQLSARESGVPSSSLSPASSCRPSHTIVG